LGYKGGTQEEGAWKGILFDDSNATGAAEAMDDNDSTILSVCRIEYIKSPSFGGIIFRFFDRARISRSRIQHCWNENGAGALHIRKSHILVRDNIIAHNYAGHNGGGIECLEFHGQLINNIIHSNYAEWEGGGISISNGSYTFVKNNTISNNFGTDGGGISIIDSDPVLQNNLIVNNSAGSGGGIGSWASRIDIINNTICNNSGGDGGGINASECHLNLVNSILWGNVGTNGPQIYPSGIGTTNVHYSLIQGGLGGINNGSYFEGETTGIIEANPEFVNESPGAGQSLQDPHGHRVRHPHQDIQVLVQLLLVHHLRPRLPLHPLHRVEELFLRVLAEIVYGDYVRMIQTGRQFHFSLKVAPCLGRRTQIR